MIRHAPLGSLALALSVALALAGCNPQSADPQPDDSGTPAAVATASGAGAELTRHHWKLSQVLGADGEPAPGPLAGLERPLQLDFFDDSLSSNGACNGFGGDYRIEDGTLQVGSLRQTLMACEGDLMAADAALVEHLEGAPRLDLQPGEPPTLTLTAADGSALVFNGEATPEARYGSAGTQVFLEVAAQRESCPHPLIPDMQCLMAREIRYDDAGLKTFVSEDWQPLYQEIEGYEHDAGTRNVLRLKRFDIADPPADASSVAYVLDMVVESEIVTGND
ncbi:META and DUF4377 domain-containing protein [Marilutibacter alkalisoli]|uniref:DUF4377 domain-containing protein n=1 Tax=Marilutibacter alkalisoli TaxID=2591633 RepID=A0A514BVP2_9GAMM|nr:META and DUF4377 domain-containing protein [Lysobacter alkalisoli]QDH71440.1 DUF4377 domain-containing protein [Lysobacter alkalisoli]